MRGFSLLILCIILCLTCGCVNYIQRGDEYFAKGYWDDAIHNYEIALEKEKDPAKINEIKQKLERAKLGGAKYYAKKAKDMIEFKSYSKALKYANLAYKYNPSPQNKELLKQVRVKEAEELFTEAQALLSSKQYDEAVTILQNAIELNPQAEYKSLFSTALSEQKEYHRNEYGRIFPSAEARFAKRDWSEAYQKYQKALKHMETDEAKSKMEFCDLMKNAEKNFDSSSSLALNYLKKAYGKGYLKDYVKEKIRLLSPVDVSITFHNAVVLPIDYNTGKTWDGILGKVYEVSEFLGGKVLSKISPQAAIAMFAGTEMTKMFTSTLVLPDCYIKINYKGSIYKSKFVPNTCNPNFEYTFNLNNVVPASKDVLSISIVDDDEWNAHDPMGTYQFELCELLKEEGKRTYIFVKDINGEEEYEFGSVYALFISVKIYDKGF